MTNEGPGEDDEELLPEMIPIYRNQGSVGHALQVQCGYIVAMLGEERSVCNIDLT